jgi:hypothetical protein
MSKKKTSIEKAEDEFNAELDRIDAQNDKIATELEGILDSLADEDEEAKSAETDAALIDLLLAETMKELGGG